MTTLYSTTPEETIRELNATIADLRAQVAESVPRARVNAMIDNNRVSDAVTIDSLNHELADLRAEAARLEAQQWEPVDAVDDAIDVEGYGPILVSVNEHHITMRQDGMGGDFFSWDLKNDMRLCRRKASEGG